MALMLDASVASILSLKSGAGDRVGSAVTASRAQRRLFTCALVVSLFLCLGSRTDPDLPWHLWAGRAIAVEHVVPSADRLTWTMAGKPWVDFEWGSQLVFYAVDRVAGADALWLFKSAVCFGMTLLFAALLILWGASLEACSLAVVAFAAALFPLVGPRPELFSMVLCLVELHWLERKRLGLLSSDDLAFALGHVVMYCLWANLHAGFAAGVLLCWAYAVGSLLDSHERELAPALTVACFAAIAGTLINPYGWRIYDVLFDHWRHIDALHRLIVEWKSPTFLKSYLEGYWLVLTFSFAGLLYGVARRRDVSGAHWFAAAVFAYFASRSVRTTAYAMLVLYPIAIYEWNRAGIPARLRRVGLGAAAFAVLFVAYRGVFVPKAAPFFERPVPIAEQGPAAACAFLRREQATLSKLTMYNPYNWGGYLGYMLSPDFKTFIDGRYLFVDLLSQVDRAQRSPVAWRHFMADRKIQLVVQENSGLMLRYPWDNGGHPYAAYYWPRAEWALVYWDSQAIVLVRRSAVPVMWLTSREYRWLRPHDLRQLGLYIVGGRVSVETVEQEIERYHREIGDPDELRVMTNWLEEFKRGASPTNRVSAPAEDSSARRAPTAGSRSAG